MLAVCIVCDLVWALSLFAGCAYFVFFHGESGWWFLLAFFCASCWTCKPYRSPEQIAADKDSKAQ